MVRDDDGGISDLIHPNLLLEHALLGVIDSALELKQQKEEKNLCFRALLSCLHSCEAATGTAGI